MAPPNKITNLACSGDSNSVAKGFTNLFSLFDGELAVNGVTLLSRVPQTVTFSSSSMICSLPTSAPPSLFERARRRSHMGGFLGFSTPAASDRPASSLGVFRGRRFLSVFRFKAWWSTMWVGSSGSELQKETQWVLFHVPELRSYVLLLPILEGKFRASIFPGRGEDDHLMLCAESGSPHVTADSFSAIAYLHAGDNPFSLMTEAFTAARVHLGTFRLREEKPLPSIVDRFGWCTWDACYLTVDPLSVWHGVAGFADGGIRLRFLVIDDGWQSINVDGDDTREDAKSLVLGGEQMTARLYRFQESENFRKYKEGSLLRSDASSYDKTRGRRILLKAKELEIAKKAKSKAIQSGSPAQSALDIQIEELKKGLEAMLAEREELPDPGIGSVGDRDVGLKAFIKDLKTKFEGLDDVYMWHALCGAWGGVRPGSTHLDSTLEPVKVSSSLAGTMDDLAVDKIVEGGIGLVHPGQAADLFDSMHSYLAAAGVTGVKVDVIHTLEFVCEEYGGRVELAKAYYEGLSKSISKNFHGSGIISSMQQCNDFFFLGTWQVPMGRTGDDFWFEDPWGDPQGVYWLQGAHMVNNAYNSLWMGQFMQPDWDMFRSDHPCGRFHAASRAISGGPVYVSDSMDRHDFDLIRKLVFPDGTTPRCQHYALPTRDCLFKNPLFDGSTVLKIWNLNKGAGWDAKERRVKGYPDLYKPISGAVHLGDVEWDQKKDCAELGKADEYAVYLDQAKKLLLMTPNSQPFRFTLQPSSFELFSFVPVKALPAGLKFAAVGLVGMFNCAGSLVEVEAQDEAAVRVRVKGEGKLVVYCNRRPKRSSLNGVEVAFQWTEEEGEVTLEIPWKEDDGGVSEVEFAY